MQPQLEDLLRMILGGDVTEKVAVGWHAVSSFDQRHWRLDG